MGHHPAIYPCCGFPSHDPSKSRLCLWCEDVSEFAHQDVILYAWHGVFGRKKKDDESQSPVRIILRREKPRRRARPRQPKPSQATQSTRRKPMPEMLKKLAPTAKAVTSFASRTTTNLRKTPAVRMQLDTSVLRRRLSLSTQRIRIPDVIGRRRPAPDVYTPSSGSSSSSSSSTSASSASHRFFKFSSLNSGRESSLRSLPSLPSATPEQTTPEAPLPARKPEYTTRLVGATLVRSSPDGCYQLIRTGIVEVPEEEERASSDDGYTSSEGSLSADSESIGSAGSSMDAGADAEVHGQTTAHSGPLGTFRRKLERTVTVLPKPQLIVG